MRNSLYPSVISYVPGTRMQHGAGNAQQRGFGGGPRGMESSASVATGDFVLTRESADFANVTAAPQG